MTFWLQLAMPYLTTFGLTVMAKKNFVSTNDEPIFGYQGPIQGPGWGYANNKFGTSDQSYDGRHHDYPFGGYRSSVPNIFLNDLYYREDVSVYLDKNIYFDRVENGCQFTGVRSYRAVDNGEYDDNDTKNWAGCVEEWTYDMSVVNDPNNATFESPPIQLYACDENESCSECQDKLRGPKFNGLALEEYEYPEDTYFVDCWIPIDYDFVNEDFLCYNEECVYMSEKYSDETIPQETPESGINCANEDPLNLPVQCGSRTRSVSIVAVVAFILVVLLGIGFYQDCYRGKRLGEASVMWDERTETSSYASTDLSVNGV